MLAVWMLLSDPVLQLPVIIADSSKELAEKCGVKKSTIDSSYSRYKHGEKVYSRYIKVLIDEKDDT